MTTGGKYSLKISFPILIDFNISEDDDDDDDSLRVSDTYDMAGSYSASLSFREPKVKKKLLSSEKGSFSFVFLFSFFL
jgi:hypothetical protein